MGSRRTVAAALACAALGLAGCADDATDGAAGTARDVAADAQAPEALDGAPADAAGPDEGSDVDAEPGPDGDAGPDATLDALTDVVDPGDVDAADVDPAQDGDVGGPSLDADASPPDAGPGPLETSLTLDPDDLGGVFVYGLGAEPSTPLTTIGNTVVGIIAVPAVVEFDADTFTIRLFDLEEAAPFPGDDGVLEAYPLAWNADGTFDVDFSSPTNALEIQLFQSCTYVLTAFELARTPEWADGLMTWAVLESYESQACGGQGLPDSTGLDVHFLRRFDGTPSFEPRNVDPTVPFGFFQEDQAGDVGGPWLSRMPGIGPGEPDGSVVYQITDDLPADLRPTVELTFEQWNDVFDDAFGQRPFATVDAEPGVIPWDPRHRVLYWDASKDQGAIAPFIAHPVTGEMFETDVIVWLGDLDDVVEGYQAFFEANPDSDFEFDWLDAVAEDAAGGSTAAVTPASAPAAVTGGALQGSAPLPAEWLPAGWDDPWTPPASWNAADGLRPNVLRRRAFPRRPLTPRSVASLMRDIDMSLPPEDIAKIVVADFVTHEVGHNLGLRHNFSASADQAHIAPGDSATSTMDYVWGMTGPGSYDRDAMRYAYGSGALTTSYLFCTDENVGADPGCNRWDFGDPLTFAIARLQEIIDATPLDLDGDSVGLLAELGEWGALFTQLRQFVNTPYEQWDPEAPTSTFQTLLDVVVCEAACPTNLYFREQLALYLLYTQHAVGEQWQAFPPLDEAQIATLFDTYLQLLLDADAPLSLKVTIVEKLPTSAVPGASEFLEELQLALATLDAPTDDEQFLLGLVDSLL